MKRQGASLVALTAVLALGTLALWTPHSTDQAIFVYGGRTILSGETLYVDFWDVKPPGIFLFYALGGFLFGFDEPGIHLLELFWMLAAAAALVRVSLAGVARPLTAVVAPWASIGAYLAFAGPDHRTQVEALMALPLALALAAAVKLARSPGAAGWGLTLGLAAGVVAAFKPVYLPLPAAFALLAAAAVARREGRRALRFVPRFALLAAGGLLAVWLPLLAYFAAHGAVGDFLWTTFLYPRESLAVGARAPLSRLAEAIGWATGVLWPWLPLAALGLLPSRDGGDPVPRWGAIVYLVLASALIAIQTISWWPYHFALLFPPLGLLASFGLDRLLELTRGRGRLLPLVAATALLALPAWTTASRALWTVGRLRAASTIRTAAPLAVRLDERYYELWRETLFLREAGRPGDIFVFGDMRILLLSERRQAIAVHGHTWALFPDSFMERVPLELMAAAPTYVYLTPYNRTVLEARAPELLEFFERRYKPMRRIGRGDLLALRPSSQD